jgi:hypothetical protein
LLVDHYIAANLIRASVIRISIDGDGKIGKTIVLDALAGQ